MFKTGIISYHRAYKDIINYGVQYTFSPIRYSSMFSPSLCDVGENFQ